MKRILVNVKAVFECIEWCLENENFEAVGCLVQQVQKLTGRQERAGREGKMGVREDLDVIRLRTKYVLGHLMKNKFKTI